MQHQATHPPELETHCSAGPVGPGIDPQSLALCWVRGQSSPKCRPSSVYLKRVETCQPQLRVESGYPLITQQCKSISLLTFFFWLFTKDARVLISIVEETLPCSDHLIGLLVISGREGELFATTQTTM